MFCLYVKWATEKEICELNCVWKQLQTSESGDKEITGEETWYKEVEERIKAQIDELSAGSLKIGATKLKYTIL